MHARSGGTLEVMGMLLGKIDGENMIVMDSFALPVEGTGKQSRSRTDSLRFLWVHTSLRGRNSRECRDHGTVLSLLKKPVSTLSKKPMST